MRRIHSATLILLPLLAVGVALAVTATGNPAATAAPGRADAPQAQTQPAAAEPATMPACEASEADGRLAEAARYVQASEQYLHHDELVRGMKGYGRTVMSGTEIVTFEVEIVSVMHKWGPHQDVILAKLSGHGLEKTGIIAGMSGSPVYMPGKDGKFRMVGAVAYGWQFQNEPLCGIQPITQMLAVGEGVTVNCAGARPDAPATQPAGKLASAQRAAPGGRSAPQAFLKNVLGAQKIDFASLAQPRHLRQASAEAADPVTAGPQLRTVATPLMTSGLGRRTLGLMTRDLAAGGIVPVQSGGVGGALAGKLSDEDKKLAPGSAISVTLASGDADITGVGTVTEVIDGRVLAFGHSMLGQGKLELPMGPAYVHTVVSSNLSSFKLGSTLGVTGALDTDEQVAIAGDIGRTVRMIPLEIVVSGPGKGRSQKFSYEICQHNYLTPALVRYMMVDAAMGWHDLPELHTVSYEMDIDFVDLGRYSTSNVASGRGIDTAISDAARPLFALLHNPLGEPAKVEKIAVRIDITPEDRSAEIVDLRLDGKTYRPGETVTGRLVVEPFRKDRTEIAVSFKLPDDLPEGTHTLAAVDASSDLMLRQMEMPHLYEPRTTEALLAALNDVVTRRGDELALRLALKEGGIAIDDRELPELPPSRAAVLRESAQGNVQNFRRALVRRHKSDYVLSGAATAGFEVVDEPQLRTHNQKGNE
jgi:hypothetical protein